MGEALKYLLQLVEKTHSEDESTLGKCRRGRRNTHLYY